ncbi:hypothetical protein E2320_022543 [Naja naja]|nr:hypothetical protein E2320_022543 [Naja naja]
MRSKPRVLDVMLLSAAVTSDRVTQYRSNQYTAVGVAAALLLTSLGVLKTIDQDSLSAHLWQRMVDRHGVRWWDPLDGLEALLNGFLQMTGEVQEEKFFLKHPGLPEMVSMPTQGFILLLGPHQALSRKSGYSFDVDFDRLAVSSMHAQTPLGGKLVDTEACKHGTW